MITAAIKKFFMIFKSGIQNKTEFKNAIRITMQGKW
jgi:hypothetical protein